MKSTTCRHHVKERTVSYLCVGCFCFDCVGWESWPKLADVCNGSDSNTQVDVSRLTFITLADVSSQSPANQMLIKVQEYISLYLDRPASSNPSSLWVPDAVSYFRERHAAELPPRGLRHELLYMYSVIVHDAHAATPP